MMWGAPMDERASDKSISAGRVMRILLDIAFLVAGAILGLVFAEPFDDYVRPRFYRTDAEVKLVSPEPLGREVKIWAKVTHVSADNSIYVVVKSDDRYWPQAPLNEHFEGEVPILLGSTGQDDVGNTFSVQVLAVSSAANSRIQNYFVKVGEQDPSVRNRGIDFTKVEGSVRHLATMELTRGP